MKERPQPPGAGASPAEVHAWEDRLAEWVDKDRWGDDSDISIQTRQAGSFCREEEEEQIISFEEDLARNAC